MSLGWTVVTSRIIVYIVVFTSYPLLGMGECNNMYVLCVCVCVHVCICVYMLYVCIYVCTFVSVHVCLCMYVSYILVFVAKSSLDILLV